MRSRSVWKSSLPFFILVACACLLYATTFGSTWTYDDMPVIVNNPDIRSLTNFLENHNPGRPIRELSYLLDYSLFGLHPAGYHLQNIFWHGLNAFLVFLLALRLQTSRPIAWLAALLFLVHPVQVEVVASSGHRKDSLALAFCLMSLLSYLCYISSSPRKWIWLVLCVSAGGVAVLAKQNALVLPLVFLAYELAMVPREDRLLGRSRLLLQVGAVAGAVAVAVWYIQLLRGNWFREAIMRAMLKVGNVVDWAPLDYLRMVLKSWSFLLSKVVWPAGLTPEYTYTVPASWLDPWVIASLAGIIAVGTAGWYLKRHDSHGFFALSWFVLLWIPTSNLFAPFAYFAADRYLYAPSVGIFIGMALLFDKMSPVNLRLRQVTAVLLVACFSVLSWQQIHIWSNPRSLYSRIVEVNPTAATGYNGLGQYYMELGDLDRAHSFFEKAGELQPNDASVYGSLGYIYYKKGELRRAVQLFEQSIALDPTVEDVHNNLGSAFDELGEKSLAIRSFSRAINLNPHGGRAYTNLGIVYASQGLLADAEKMHRRAISEAPDYGEAHYNLAVTLFQENRLAESRTEFLAATQLMPKHANALYNLAIVSLKIDGKNEAMSLLPRLEALDAELGRELERELRKIP